MPKWFVVTERLWDDDDEINIDDECVWTLSRNPHTPGWNTDSGFPGYGLCKREAEELAFAANMLAAIRRVIFFWRG